MTIKLTEAQQALLANRSAAAQSASAKARAAQQIAMQAQQHAEELQTALAETISCFASDGGAEPGQKFEKFEIRSGELVLTEEAKKEG